MWEKVAATMLAVALLSSCHDVNAHPAVAGTAQLVKALQPAYLQHGSSTPPGHHAARGKRWSFWPFGKSSADEISVTTDAPSVVPTSTTTTTRRPPACRPVLRGNPAPYSNQTFLEEKTDEEKDKTSMWSSLNPFTSISTALSSTYRKVRYSSFGIRVRNSTFGEVLSKSKNATRRGIVVAGRKIKYGAGKVGDAVREGYRAIKRKMTGEQKYNYYIDQVKNGVESGNEETISMLSRLGIVVCVDETGKTKTIIDDKSRMINEILENEGFLLKVNGSEAGDAKAMDGNKEYEYELNYADDTGGEENKWRKNSTTRAVTTLDSVNIFGTTTQQPDSLHPTSFQHTTSKPISEHLGVVNPITSSSPLTRPNSSTTSPFIAKTSTNTPTSSTTTRTSTLSSTPVTQTSLITTTSTLPPQGTILPRSSTRSTALDSTTVTHTYFRPTTNPLRLSSTPSPRVTAVPTATHPAAPSSTGTDYFPSPFGSNGVAGGNSAFPDVFSDNAVRERLRDIYERGDFSHSDLNTAFNFSPKDDHYTYDYSDYY